MSKQYTAEFKQQIISLRQSGHSARELCLQYGLGRNTVRDWIRASTTPKDVKIITQADEMKAIRKRLDYQEREIEILKRLTLVNIQSKKR